MENYTITQLREKLLQKELSATEVVKYYLERIEKHDTEINSYTSVLDEQALNQAKEFDGNFEKEKSKKLGGIPISVKDVFSTKNIPTTCASKMLETYSPVYNSTVVKRLLDESAIVLGKTNLDEFCHGSSTTTSYFGRTKNPWDNTKLPGGSSGGSAAALAADFCAGTVGTETAGSIRLPASWCGVVGVKPTYSRVSRYGVLSMGSSLDCPGPLGKDVKDCAYLLEIMAGFDSNDFTSSKKDVPNYLSLLEKSNVKGLKLALPKEYIDMDLEDGVRKNFLKSIDILKGMGIEIEEVSLLDPKLSIAVYTLTCRGEVSSNLARYDGTRYGLSTEDISTITENYEMSRGEGFGQEVKRRIMTGTISLSSGYAEECFRKSEKVRELIKKDFANIFKKYDAIVGPATPSVALTEKEAENPLFGELADVLSEGSSLAGLPGISIPSGLSNDLPTGIQFIANHFEEPTMFSLAYALEKEIGRVIPKL